LPHGNAGCCDKQHHRQKRDLPLGSLHSKTVLRVEWLSESSRTQKIRGRLTECDMTGYRELASA
jgi:hypothetical protein